MDKGLVEGPEEAAGSPEACDMGNIFKDLREEGAAVRHCILNWYTNMVFFVVLSFGSRRLPQQTAHVPDATG
jgi:hypothetical protein